MRWIRTISLAAGGLLAFVVVLVALAIAVFYGMTVLSSRGGEPMLEGMPTAMRRPDALSADRLDAGPALAGDDSREGEGAPREILFGDLHVHTNYSADSFLQSYQIPNLDSRRTPADACDFARFCSQLDFWSINDHAESLTPEHWRATVDAVRACDAIAGGPEEPDLVSFLGWEWSHAGRAEEHYGHKNVVLADLSDAEIPTRPIASAAGPPWPFLAIGTLGALTGDRPYSDFASFHRYAMETLEVEECPGGIPSPELPEDCRESAPTPAALFAKLDEWGKRALVIPHGLAWGTTNPPHARLDVQLEQHDPAWQRLLEVYSGHGNSEDYVAFERPRQDAEGSWICPTGDSAANDGIEFCCERARVLARAECEAPDSARCEERVEEAVQAAASIDSGYGIGTLATILPGTRVEAWGDCSQPEGRFLPSWNYRPRQSAQYALALDRVDGEPVEDRFRFGFIASSDTHRSRPGTGYKETGRLIMTDGVRYPIPPDLTDARQSSFYFSGGLAAVHAPRHDREAVFESLARREVYATSGDRILLWFDLVEASGARRPMGSEVQQGEAPPRFEVRAVGARKQKPGCPDFVHDALSQSRIESLCLNECHNPGDERKRISRIEVVRISPRAGPDDPGVEGIRDPWRVFECPLDRDDCRFDFEDPEYASDPAETVYYVRAIEAPSPAINGGLLRCERDEVGRCVSARICGTRPDGSPDDCLSPVEERAWSSPIFVLPRSL